MIDVAEANQIIWESAFLWEKNHKIGAALCAGRYNKAPFPTCLREALLQLVEAICCTGSFAAMGGWAYRMDRINKAFLFLLFCIKNQIEGLRQWMLSKHFE